ncbi:MAG: hypothetical protein E7638_05725 [Ruminococcaceae bacterium]|nr:hypothetical protein [Oscillospiraceae bacterium]
MAFKETFKHDFYPFKNQAEIDRVRKITFEDIKAMNGKHPNGNPNISVELWMDEEAEMVMITDMVQRIIDSDRFDKPAIFICPNPCPTYRKVAYMLQQMKVNMRNVKFYMMDEWADEDGNIAPLSYKGGFGYAFEKFMIKEIQGLGFKPENFIYHSNKTTPDMSKMIEADGEADAVYSGPGWPGHMAFIDPVEDWFCDTMEEYLAQGSKVTALHPLTIAQNSLHGGFGLSGDISKVPPKGAMIGPRDVMKAKNVIDVHSISTAGTKVTWQRLTSRLCIFGEPSQEVPASIVQLRDLPTRIIMGHTNAATIVDEEYFQY